MASLFSVGPIVAGAVVLLLFRDRKHPIWPFHKDSFSSLGFHTLVSFLMCVVPAHVFALGVLQPPGALNNSTEGWVLPVA